MMVYKFMMDGSGKVIAEKRDENIESYLGLHYPESDIPKQARELYLKKRKRIFSNVHSETVPILSKSDETIDLTYSGSRVCHLFMVSTSKIPELLPVSVYLLLLMIIFGAGYLPEFRTQTH
jgi:light-regulated signal transduction histidine kinase (bacteriophytochrome)